MKQIILSAFTVFFYVAFAQAVSTLPTTVRKDFSLDSRTDFGGEVYYNCQSVESDLRAMLQQMGAKNIDVLCRGGIDSNQPPFTWNADVSLQFETLKLFGAGPVEASWQQRHIHSFDNCHLLNQVFQKIQADVDLTNVTGTSSCPRADSGYQLEFMTLIAN